MLEGFIERNSIYIDQYILRSTLYMSLFIHTYTYVNILVHCDVKLSKLWLIYNLFNVNVYVCM